MRTRMYGGVAGAEGRPSPLCRLSKAANASEISMTAVFLILLFVALWGEFLLPLPSLILSWREWPRVRRTSPSGHWRRHMSRIGLVFLTCGVTLWIYGMVPEWYGG